MVDGGAWICTKLPEFRTWAPLLAMTSCYECAAHCDFSFFQGFGFCTECSLDSSSRACVAPGYCQRYVFKNLYPLGIGNEMVESSS